MSKNENNNSVKIKEKSSSLGKIALFATIFSLGLITGDQTQPITKLQDNIKYYNLSAEDGTPTDFRNYELKIDINNKGRAELYLGNKQDSVYRLVNVDGTVGNLGSKIDNYVDDKSNQVKEWFNDLKEKYNSNK